MAQVELKTRIQNKIDTQANWDAQTNFIPLAGEIIIYKDLNKFKIGDGETKLANLPFMTAEKLNIADIVNNLTSTATNKPLAAAQGKALKDLIDDIEKLIPTKVSQLENDEGYIANVSGAEGISIWPTENDKEEDSNNKILIQDNNINIAGEDSYTLKLKPNGLEGLWSEGGYEISQDNGIAYYTGSQDIQMGSALNSQMLGHSINIGELVYATLLSGFIPISGEGGNIEDYSPTLMMLAHDKTGYISILNDADKEALLDFNFNGSKLKNIDNPIDENDAANKKYVDDKMTEVINQILSMYPPAENLIIYPTVEGVEF